MPIYEYKCIECNRRDEIRTSSYLDGSAIFPNCADCGGKTKIVVSLGGKPDYGFVPFHTENISGEMEHIGSRSIKKRLMAKYDVIEAG